jgi:hypothetical protein
MNFFWSNVFDYFKDRRFAPVFFITLAVLFGVPLAVALLVGTTNIGDYFRYWPFMAGVFTVWLLISIRRSFVQARARRKDRYKIRPLSRDELNKARSKLLKR